MKIPKLSDNHRLVCAALQLNSELSFGEVAQLTQIPEHSVRYVISSLKQRGSLYRAPIVNFYALGLQEFVLYFSLVEQAKEITSRIFDFFCNDIPTTWFGSFGPNADYLAVIPAQSPLAFSNYLNSLTDTFGNIFKHKCHEVVNRYTYYGRRFVASIPLNLKPIVLEQPAHSVQIDSLDIRILSCLSSFEQLSTRKLSLRLGESHSTIDYRIKRLSETGVIAGMILSTLELCKQVTPYRIRIFTGGTSSKLREALYSFCQREMNVIGFLEVSASWDYTIRLELEPAHNIDAILNRLVKACGCKVRLIVDSPASAIKQLTFPPLLEKTLLVCPTSPR